MKKVLATLMSLILLFAMFSFPAAATDRPPLSVPILMYHHLAELEEYNTMTVSPDRFRQDMEFLRDNGFTPLLPGDLERIAAGQADMPARPVMITFDDGYESNYTLAYPILQETGMKATIALIAQSVRYTDTKKMWTLTWAQCREMYTSGLVAFGSHTYNLHNPDNKSSFRPGGPNGIERLPGETREQYDLRVGVDLRNSISMIENSVGCSVNYFAYPFGVTDPWFYDLLDKYGVTVAVTTNTALADLGRGTMDLPRMRVDMSQPLSEILAHFFSLQSPAVTSYVSVTVEGKVSYMPSIVIDGQHYVSLPGIATLLAKTPAAFTYSGMVFERGNYRGKCNQEINAGHEVRVDMVGASLTFEERDHVTITPRAGGDYYFTLEEMADFLHYLCDPVLVPQTDGVTPAAYVITFED